MPDVRVLSYIARKASLVACIPIEYDAIGDRYLHNKATFEVVWNLPIFRDDPASKLTIGPPNSLITRKVVYAVAAHAPYFRPLLPYSHQVSPLRTELAD